MQLQAEGKRFFAYRCDGYGYGNAFKRGAFVKQIGAYIGKLCGQNRALQIGALIKRLRADFRNAVGNFNADNACALTERSYRDSRYGKIFVHFRNFYITVGRFAYARNGVRRFVGVQLVCKTFGGVCVTADFTGSVFVVIRFAEFFIAVCAAFPMRIFVEQPFVGAVRMRLGRFLLGRGFFSAVIVAISVIAAAA